MERATTGPTRRVQRMAGHLLKGRVPRRYSTGRGGLRSCPVKFNMWQHTATDETGYRGCGVGKEVGHHFGAVSPSSSWTGSWCRTAYCVHVLAGTGWHRSTLCRL